MRTSQRSVMKHDFSKVPKVEIPRSSFDRSHGHKTTFDGGYLIPILVDEALPGDTFSCNMTALARLATPIYPIMDNLTLNTFFFAVPMRLLWTNWERFNGAQDEPDDSIDFTCPQIANSIGITEGTLYDYMGIPPGVTTLPFNNFAGRAYNLIYNEWFRDENLQDSVVVDVDNGPDVIAGYSLLRRGKRKDYFTSALPSPQRGDSVDLPLGTSAPVVLEGTGIPTFDTATVTGVPLTIRSSDGSAGLNSSLNAESIIWNDTALEADLTTATSATINAIRQAFQIQRLLERDARGGTRYTEIIRSHFGVTSPDARLQRPEYLGGGSSPVTITPVVRSAGAQGSGLGELSGFGTAALRNHAFTQSFTEHCMIIGLVSAQADLTYQQGLNRMWSRQTRYDFFWPSLSHLGEQSVLNIEIFAQGDANDALTFGYQERYGEYRYFPSQISGLFRSDATGSLDAWHLSQDFSALPVLDATFIEDTPPIDRVVAVGEEAHFIMDMYFSMKCARPMPMYGVPGMIDHF